MSMNDNIYIVAGNSEDSGKYWYRIYADIKAFGWQVYCVNPLVDDVGGERIYPDLHSLPQQGNVLILVTRPDISETLVDEAIKFGYKEIWFQPGAYSEAAAAKAQHNGLAVRDECFMTANNIW